VRGRAVREREVVKASNLIVLRCSTALARRGLFRKGYVKKSNPFPLQGREKKGGRGDETPGSFLLENAEGARKCLRGSLTFNIGLQEELAGGGGEQGCRTRAYPLPVALS